MSEKEYTVIVKAGVNLEEVENDLTASSGDSSSIPNRSVDIVNARPGSRRATHFALTDEEAKNLENDPRVEAVEIPPDQRDDIKIGFNATQIANFTKGGNPDTDTSKVNWGLKRANMPTNLYASGTTTDQNYEYALEGEGVDIVIQDSGVQFDHPEFIDNLGNNRCVSFDWYSTGVAGSLNANFYRDYDGHGTHCAGIVAGKTYGFAKKARIFSQKLSGLEGAGDTGTGMPILDSFDAIRLWHASKPVQPNGYKRPTVVNMSWGYYSEVTGNPTGGTYRGTSWTYGVDYTTRNGLWAGTGVVPELAALSASRMPNRVTAVDAEVEDLIAGGVHVVIAAGNDFYKGDLSTGNDYNNSVVYGGLTYFYHRGSSPHSDNSLMVGNIDTGVQNDQDKTYQSSSRGPRVNIWAPGTNIFSCVSTTNVYSGLDYPPNTSFKIAKLNGTSFAAPQVAGVSALIAGANPQITPAQLKSQITADAKSVIYNTASDTDYDQFGTSLLGADNKMLFNKYGRQPFIFKNIGLG